MLTTLSEPATTVMSYDAKTADYFQGSRGDFLDRLPANPDAALLEVGCGEGNTAAGAKHFGRCGYAAGVELFEGAGLAARKQLDEVAIGNIETVDLPWANETFDILILSEVLEHLTDPWLALRRLQPLMKPGCLVLASSPNIAHWHLISELVAGDWELADSGPKDRTHLRWFTPKSFRNMFTECGFQVRKVYPVRQYGWKGRLVSALSGGRLEHLFISRICLEATVAQPAR